MRINDLTEESKRDEKKSLYLSRKVKNGKAILDWAKSQGFETILDPEDMHVTIAYSDAPIDWDALGDTYKSITVKKPSTRSIQEFDGGAIVLTLENADLTRRWQEAIELGASWSYEDYSPHVTLSYGGSEGLILEDMSPYDGDIELGEEIFAEVNKKWKGKVKEKDLNAEGDDDDSSLPAAYWYHAERGTYIECEDHAQYVADHHRKMKLDPTEVSEIISAEGDEDLTEIEEEELCDLAIENGWVIGRKSHINAGDIDDLRAAAEFFAEKWPNHQAKLILRHSWEHVFEPAMIEEFTKHGMLPEGVQEVDSVPKKFWLVFDIPSHHMVGGEHAHEAEEILRGIQHGSLKGVKGISGSREIMTEWFHVGRNAALVMDAQKVLAQNDVLRVNYADAKALIENGMEALYRLFNRRQDKLGHIGLMQNLFRYFISELRKVNYSLSHDMNYYGFETRAADYYAEKKLSEESFSISTLDELTDYIIQVSILISNEGGSWRSHLVGLLDKVDRDQIRDTLKQAVINIGSVYSVESEWLVKNNTFKVPADSILLVLADKSVQAKYGAWLAAEPSDRSSMTKYMPSERFGLERLQHTLEVIEKYKLDARYTIKLIDEMHFSKIRSDVVARRRARKENK